MFFDEEFIKSVEENPIVGIVEACNVGMHELKKLGTHDGWNEVEHEHLWDVASFLEQVIESNQFHINIVFPEATGDIEVNSENLHGYINKVKSGFEEHSIKLKIESYKGRYKSAFKSSFAYEFSQGDYGRIQGLLNELRAQISSNDILEPDHKRRLLKRLEGLQSELHKRVSDLDKFWGMVGDAGVVLGKLGTDAKPIVDRITEIAEIVWRTQARTEELPSNTSNPMLRNDESSQ